MVHHHCSCDAIKAALLANVCGYAGDRCALKKVETIVAERQCLAVEAIAVA